MDSSISTLISSVLDIIGTDRHSDTSARHVRNFVLDSDNQTAQTAVPYSPGVRVVGICIVRSVCVPKKEVHNIRYVRNCI